MRYWNLRRDVLRCIAILGRLAACVIAGCGGNGGDDIGISGQVSLAAADGAALAGLMFDFPDATIFGFPGESAILQIGENAATFTLTSSGRAAINGTISAGGVFVACQLRQNPAEVGAGGTPFVQDYVICEATVVSNRDIAFGRSGPGVVILRLARANEPPVTSAAEEVTLTLNNNGTVTINMNQTPI